MLELDAYSSTCARTTPLARLFIIKCSESVSSGGAGSEGFMGVIKPIADDANIAMVYVTPAGIIVSVGRGFNNLFGHETAEHIGRPLRSICKDPEEFNKLLSGAVASTTSSGLTRAASGVEGQDVGNLTIAHKFGDEITVRVKIMKVRLGCNLVSFTTSMQHTGYRAACLAL